MKAAPLTSCPDLLSLDPFRRQSSRDSKDEDDGASAALLYSGWFSQHVGPPGHAEHSGAPRPARPLNFTAEKAAKRRRAKELLAQSVATHSFSPLLHSSSMPNLHVGEHSPRDDFKRPTQPPNASSPSRCLCLPCGALWRVVGREPAGRQETPRFDSPGSAVIIFDWDDTLFPTTFVMQRVMPALPNFKAVSEDSSFYDVLAAHAHLVGFVLRAARAIARVSIVTLSKAPWVVFSASRYLPGLNMDALLRELGISVFYCRDYAERLPVKYNTEEWSVDVDRTGGHLMRMGVGELEDGSLSVHTISEGGLIAEWNLANPLRAIMPHDRIVEVNSVRGTSKGLVEQLKSFKPLHIRILREVPDRDPLADAKRAYMADCLEDMYGKGAWRRNVLSIGDSDTEQNALKELLHQGASEQGDALCKTVNLLDHPSLEQLSQELRILSVWLPRMVKYNRDFDFHMTNLDTLEQQLVGC